MFQPRALRLKNQLVTNLPTILEPKLPFLVVMLAKSLKSIEHRLYLLKVFENLKWPLVRSKIG